MMQTVNERLRDESIAHAVWISRYSTGVAAWRKGFEKEGIWSTIQLALGNAPEPVKPDPFAAELANWSLKSLMQKSKGLDKKGASE